MNYKLFNEPHEVYRMGPINYNLFRLQVEERGKVFVINGLSKCGAYLETTYNHFGVASSIFELNESKDKIVAIGYANWAITFGETISERLKQLARDVFNREITPEEALAYLDKNYKYKVCPMYFETKKVINELKFSRR